MKKVLLVFSAMALIFVVSCEKKKPVEVTNAQDAALPTQNAMKFEVDTLASKVEWKGFKFYEAEKREDGHNGFMKLKSGEVSYEDNIITAGKFVINVASIESLDLNDTPEKKAKLDNHLKAEDILDVQTYPTATFTITEVKPLEGEYNALISGNLKMRDVEKNISFKANVTLEDHTLKINSEEFVISREDFGIVFKGMKGVTIKDNVALKVDVVAKHKM